MPHMITPQLPLLHLPDPTAGSISASNKLLPQDRPVHDWYRFVLSFPPHLVRRYLEKFNLGTESLVLDPFCGTGTTLVESKKLRVRSIGLEVNPMAHFASKVKTDWSPDPDGLASHAAKIADIATEELANSGENLLSLPEDSMNLLLKGSISALPLHKVLLLVNVMKRHRDSCYFDHEMLTLAKTIVFTASNLQFGPEVGAGPPKVDAPVIESWLDSIRQVSADLVAYHEKAEVLAMPRLADARQAASRVPTELIDGVITSPPYPNEKDYTRTTRLESVLLGFIRNRQDLRALKQDLVKSNTRGVYKSDRDDVLVHEYDQIQDIAEAIESRRIELGKTSGFERLYSRVTTLYFGGMYRHLDNMRRVLRPGAQLAYVVGDQASYLQVMIRTGELLGQIAESLGFQVTGLDLFRTRLATATKQQLREEVLVLRWPGTQSSTRSKTMAQGNRYSAIIEKIFQSKFRPGMREVDFQREDIITTAEQLGIELPKNLGDLVYSFRYRATLPESIVAAGGAEVWIIRPAGRAKYRFVLVPNRPIVPNENILATKVPESTPGIVAKYALSDEQALLAKLRYNRLIDVFTGVTCYSLQNHLRTSVPNMGQVETDELYVGVDKKGAHYVIPVQAKGGKDRISIVQIEQDIALCSDKFPSLICRPIAAQFMRDDVIAVFEFEEGDEGLGIVAERHYRLVAPEDVTDEDLGNYRLRT